MDGLRQTALLTHVAGEVLKKGIVGAWVGRCGGKDGWQAVGPWHRPMSQWPRKGSYI